MTGITNLTTLIASMQPVLKTGEYVFATFESIPWNKVAELNPISMFNEDEGLSLVIGKATADTHGIAYDSVFRLITLQVNSSLDAVGLTAAFSSAIGQAGISANVVAAYHHDHIFVPADKADEAIRVLRELASSRQ